MQMLQEWAGDRQSDSQSVIETAWRYMKIFRLLTLESCSLWYARQKKYNTIYSLFYNISWLPNWFLFAIQALKYFFRHYVYKVLILNKEITIQIIE